MRTFKEWIEKRQDIFGFEKEQEEDSSFAVKNQDPIMQVDIEHIMDELANTKIHGKRGKIPYINEIHWGDEIGSLKLLLSPAGSGKAIISGKQTDLENKDCWICKSIIPYVNLEDASFRDDENLADILYNKIDEIGPIEIPKAEYLNLEKLTIKLSRKCCKPDVIPKIFIYTGIREVVKDKNYIIKFECKGQGAEAPGEGGGNRLEMFAIETSYNDKTGLIRCMGYGVTSPMKGHKWEPQPSDWDEYFSPKQKSDEICEAIANALSIF
jgi:hypothetical protein